MRWTLWGWAYPWLATRRCSAAASSSCSPWPPPPSLLRTCCCSTSPRRTSILPPLPPSSRRSRRCGQPMAAPWSSSSTGSRPGCRAPTACCSPNGGSVLSLEPAGLAAHFAGRPDSAARVWLDHAHLPSRTPVADPGGVVMVATGLAVADRLPPTDLTVRAGEVVAVTGPPGSGKSTLLACLAGLWSPRRGPCGSVPGPIASASIRGAGHHLRSRAPSGSCSRTPSTSSSPVG